MSIRWLIFCPIINKLSILPVLRLTVIRPTTAYPNSSSQLSLYFISIYLFNYLFCFTTMTLVFWENAPTQFSLVAFSSGTGLKKMVMAPSNSSQNCGAMISSSFYEPLNKVCSRLFLFYGKRLCIDDGVIPKWVNGGLIIQPYSL